MILSNLKNAAWSGLFVKNGLFTAHEWFDTFLFWFHRRNLVIDYLSVSDFHRRPQSRSHDTDGRLGSLGSFLYDQNVSIQMHEHFSTPVLVELVPYRREANGDKLGGNARSRKWRRRGPSSGLGVEIGGVKVACIGRVGKHLSVRGCLQYCCC